jgi:hypothetical protein
MKNKFKVFQHISIGFLIIINGLNISVGFSFWDELNRTLPNQTIQIGTGTEVVFEQTAANFNEFNLLIADNMATRTSNDINTSITTTYTIDLRDKETNETITPLRNAGVGETWFAEVKIGNVSIINDEVDNDEDDNDEDDVTANGAGALQFAVDFIQDGQTTNGNDVTVLNFNANKELVESIAIIDNGTYRPTQFQIHLSIINLYTDAHSIALHGANVTYDIFLEITKTVETM